MRVQIVRDIAIGSGPCFERLELALRLAHVAVEVIEVAEGQGAGFRAGVRIRGIESLMVLDEDEYGVFPCLSEKRQVLGEEFCRGFGDQDVHSATDGVECDWEVSGVGCEDGDC